MKKGISLIVLVITIIILVILTGIIVFNASATLVSTDKMKLQTDIVQLEYLMETYKMRKNGNINFESVEFDVSSLNSEELSQFAGEPINDNKIQLYVVDLYEIDAESVNFGNLKYGPTDRFVYSPTTEKVYYEKGLEAENITYYHIQDGE